METMSVSEAVTDFYEVLGPFHEFLPEENVSSIPKANHKINGDPEVNSIEGKLVETEFST